MVLINSCISVLAPDVYGSPSPLYPPLPGRPPRPPSSTLAPLPSLSLLSSPVSSLASISESGNACIKGARVCVRACACQQTPLQKTFFGQVNLKDTRKEFQSVFYPFFWVNTISLISSFNLRRSHFVPGFLPSHQKRRRKKPSCVCLQVSIPQLPTKFPGGPSVNNWRRTKSTCVRCESDIYARRMLERKRRGGS